MNNQLLSNKPISTLISYAIELAQKGERQQAIELLEEVERELFRKKTKNSSQNLNLIELIRNKYHLLNLSKDDLSKNQFQNGMVGAGAEKKLPGITLVNCARNRTENLLKAIPTWLFHHEIKEIIIIDWGSYESVREALDQNKINDKRVKVVQVIKEPRWILSYAYNLGFRLAQHEYILKVDADITLKENFFQKNNLVAGTFIAGDWKKAEKGQEHINGFFYLRTDELLRIKGFNEFITTYGWDDDDIYARLETSGLKRVCVDTQSIYHIPHDDASRLDGVKKETTNAWTQLQGDPLFKIRANRYLTLVLPYWSSDRLFAPFRVLENKNNLITVERVLVDMPHIVSKTIRDDAEFYAAMEMVSWRVGPTAYHLNRSALYKLLTSKALEEISQFDIDVLSHNEITEVKRHSIYLEFQLKNTNFDFNDLVSFINSKISKNVAIYVSSYGIGGKEFCQQYGSEAIQLTKWVRTKGLSDYSLDDLKSDKNFDLAHSGVHVKITDDFIGALKKHTPIASHINIKQKFYIDVQHGLGNRLRAYASAAAIAKETDRELVLVWVPDHHCECKISDLYDYDGEVIEKYVDLPSNLMHYNYMDTEPGANKGELIDVSKKQNILVRSAFVLNHPSSSWDAECAVLRKLKPAQEVLELVNTVPLPEKTLSVHVRMEAGKGLDHHSYDSIENWGSENHELIHFWREKSHYSVFIKKIDQLLSTTDASIFLATDLKENYEIFKSYYENKLLMLKRYTYDRSKEQIIYSLADAILLSKGFHLLGSNWSSFSELASRLSTSYKKIEMSGIDF